MKKIFAIRLQNISDMISNGEYEKAKAKCRKYFDDPKFISCYIKILMLEGNYEEAEELCKDHLDHLPILSQFITILTKTNRFELAKEYCERNPDNEEIIPGYILVLSHFGEIDKVKEIGRKHPYNRFICKSYVLALIKYKYYHEALKVCKKHIYDPSMADIHDRILRIMSNSRMSSLEKVSNFSIGKIIDCMDNNEYLEAKVLCKKYMDQPGVFDLYLTILENERVNSKKTYKLVDKNK